MLIIVQPDPNRQLSLAQLSPSLLDNIVFVGLRIQQITQAQKQE